MKKNTFGINTAKLNSYLKSIRKDNRAAILHTVRDENGEDHVWLFSDFLALRVPTGYVYKEVMQPCTMTDAPEYGESKDLTGRGRDGDGLTRTVEEMFLKAEKLARDTRFVAEYGERGKNKAVRVYALEDGESAAVNADYAGIFEAPQNMTIRGSSYYGPLTFEGNYSIKGVIMPVRIGSELRERMDALCACFAMPGARKEEQAA